MSDQTFESLYKLVMSNRREREEKVRMMEGDAPSARPKWSMRIALEDQQYRSQLESIEEIPELLRLLPRLQENWPYPSPEALEVSRAELAHLTKQPAREVDILPLRDIMNRLRQQMPRTNGPSPRSLSGSWLITEADLAKWPRWARVAFAARCVRRMQRMLTEFAPRIPLSELDGIDQAITLAEQSAAEGRTVEGTADVAMAALQRAQGQVAVGRRPDADAHGVPQWDTLRYLIGNAAAQAAQAAINGNPRAAFDAYENATHAAIALRSSRLLDGMRRDFRQVDILAAQENWTEETPVPQNRIPQPCLKLVGLHIRELRAIRQLDLPQDGLGWQGQIPDLMLLSGINGSGKTTLLNFLCDALALIPDLLDWPKVSLIPKSLDAREAWVDFEIESYDDLRSRVRFLVGDSQFVASQQISNSWSITRLQNGHGFPNFRGNDLFLLRSLVKQGFSNTTIPSVLFLPSENRALLVPEESYKITGRLAEDARFVYRYQPPSQWKQSLEGFLYSLRWEDLNAKEEGRFTEINHFAAYADALRQFTGDSKYLTFERGELVVKIAGSDTRHGLEELSGGEKQMLLLCGELLRRWRPGSLILIDEPELHLHTQWQTKFYEALRYWQKERGGQVILATQSGHLVEIGENGGLALLGRETP